MQWRKDCPKAVFRSLLVPKLRSPMKSSHECTFMVGYRWEDAEEKELNGQLGTHDPHPYGIEVNVAVHQPQKNSFF